MILSSPQLYQRKNLAKSPQLHNIHKLFTVHLRSDLQHHTTSKYSYTVWVGMYYVISLQINHCVWHQMYKHLHKNQHTTINNN